MPLTPLQKDVLQILAGHRNPDSFVAGGAVINRAEASPRFSADLDLFHDTPEAIPSSAEADVASLIGRGLIVAWLLRQPSLYRVQVERGAETMRLDWCHDSAFRFFPVSADPEFGYCLHPADIATNKALALAGRSEIRDYVDVLFLHESYLSLGAICWAACGKDEGFTPWSLLDFAKRNMKFREENLAGENLATPMRLTDLKEKWLRAADQARVLFERLPPAEVGCLYLDKENSPVTPDPDVPGFGSLVRHFGTVRGAWPKPA